MLINTIRKVRGKLYRLLILGFDLLIGVGRYPRSPCYDPPALRRPLARGHSAPDSQDAPEARFWPRPTQNSQRFGGAILR